jgi:hypothetical protein
MGVALVRDLFKEHLNTWNNTSFASNSDEARGIKPPALFLSRFHMLFPLTKKNIVVADEQILGHQILYDPEGQTERGSKENSTVSRWNFRVPAFGL